MIGYLKKNKLHIYLLLVIAALASLPLMKDTVLTDVSVYHRWILVLANLATTLISYSCFRIMFGGATVGILGSMLYTWCPLRYGTLYISGDLEESLAWSFVPIVLLGFVRIYSTSEEGREKKRVWMTLTLGFVLLAVCSITYFGAAVGASMLLVLLMGKKSFCKQNLICIGKAVLATLILGGWFLVPDLLPLRSLEVIGSLLPENFRMSGFYPAHYLSLFSDKGMGTAVLLLVLIYLWCLFVKKFEDALGKKILLWVIVLLWLGSNLFPWDLFQNKNMLFSVVLAILRTPTSWAVPAYAGFVWIGCRMLQKMEESGNVKLYQGTLVLTALVSFGMNQLFVLGL